MIVLKADLASKLMDRDPARAAQEVRDVARVSREALAEVRQAVQGFRTTTFTDELARATAVLRTAGADVTATLPDTGGSGSAAAEQALALVLRETVTNVLRTSTDIAATRQLSEGTVRNYLSEAISKVGARNRVEAANLARARGWL